MQEPEVITAVAVRENTSQEVARAEDFMPMLTVEKAVQRKSMMTQYIAQVLHEGIEGDYSKIPGAGDRKVLLKPGAEKLCSIFGLAPKYLDYKVIEDWTGADHGGEPLFYYAYRCQMWRGNRLMGEAIGSANSWESKYRYRWIPEDQAKLRADFKSLLSRGGKRTMFEANWAIDKAETTGKYGKPAEYWERFRAAIASGEAKPGDKKMGEKTHKGYSLTVDETQYRIPNPEAADIINTCQKMAQKRALVAAVLIVTNASDSFTQDLEDELPPPTQHQNAPPVVDVEPEPQEPARPIPEEMKDIISSLTTANIRQACELMQRQMVEASPQYGQSTYERIMEAAKEKRGTARATRDMCVDVVLSLYDALVSMRAEYTDQQVQDDVQKDVPF